ncbi:hypothetical protein [Spongiibacter sp. IMCC21906]|jgi:hypothetical protein|uniref:hypothetical protein n=1 Tax=Spongiibacter sp. IMCC21906 TaxID=1620392 RepID=UPI00062E86A3|nr:hypothetical protein [Spongiibacter sp. IMCC21906]
MTNAITFPNARTLAATDRLADYMDRGKAQFEEIKKAKLFHPDSEWEHDTWRYRANGGESVLFARTTEERAAGELIGCLKCQIIELLYDNRLKGSLPTLIGQTQGLRKLIQHTKITTLSQLNQDSYNTFLNEINDRTPRGQNDLINKCNAQIKWLEKRNLIATPIDLSSGFLLSQLPAIPARMPSRNLIQNLLEARWKIAENEEDTLQWANDMISVLAQSFQYGMGLRIGETLRLPKEPIQYRDGKMFFIVWTEKGKPPIARYVPTEWQEVFETSIREIQRITEPYRKRAIELETTGRLTEVDEALTRFRKEKEDDFAAKLHQLHSFLDEKERCARKAWQEKMRGTVHPDQYYTVSELQKLLPLQVTSDRYAYRLARIQFEKCGIIFEVDPNDTTRHVRYRALGKNVLDRIDYEIAFRANHLTDLEISSIVHNREINHCPKENTRLKIFLKKEREGAAFRVFTMKTHEAKNHRGYMRKVLTKKDAETLLETYCLGGYDHNEWIDVGSFNTLFLGDIFHSTTSIAVDAKERKRLHKHGLVISEKQAAYSKSNSDLFGYTSKTCYLIKQESIHDFVLQRFKESNLNAEAEIYEDALNIDESTNNVLAVRIDSKSFHIKQKVSDYLMLTGKTSNGGGQRFVPTILGYKTLTYSFVGGGRYDYPGLFERYGITNDKKIISEFQTHKGRHWKTTSLFRSGASSEVVNLWMGRDPNQGAQYDHRTDRERAEHVKAAMKEDSSRFVGHVPAKLRHFQENELHVEMIDDFLDHELVTVHHSDRGMCKRELALKPCEMSMHCLSGKDGKGCKDYIIDLGDAGQIERLTAWADREQRELARLENQKQLGITAAQVHLDARTPAFKNATMILETHSRRDSIESTEIRPFYLEGSDPNDCPFGCGD